MYKYSLFFKLKVTSLGPFLAERDLCVAFIFGSKAVGRRCLKRQH